MRFAYEPPPWLAPQNTPKVKSVIGLGTGGGAAVQTADSDGFGAVRVTAGPNASAAGNVVLTFPLGAPPVLFIAGDDAFGPLLSVAGADYTISWSAAALKAGVMHRIHYEWAVSR
jgi:hypothetical protein